ncbi:hypothetical protein EV356DRAFT_234074 [Viridothelium virens]|uniref:Uncharacterized protein n=1 Tax=Viridothelium virens TaxID=1048519 RepID=A0A6A6H4L5_VIRVR|nr:hypothetical protein EV356DRAFT_234074 [Viridothelium virens]
MSDTRRPFDATPSPRSTKMGSLRTTHSELRSSLSEYPHDVQSSASVARGPASVNFSRPSVLPDTNLNPDLLDLENAMPFLDSALSEAIDKSASMEPEDRLHVQWMQRRFSYTPARNSMNPHGQRQTRSNVRHISLSHSQQLDIWTIPCDGFGGLRNRPYTYFYTRSSLPEDAFYLGEDVSKDEKQGTVARDEEQNVEKETDEKEEQKDSGTEDHKQGEGNNEDRRDHDDRGGDGGQHHLELRRHDEHGNDRDDSGRDSPPSTPNQVQT